MRLGTGVLAGALVCALTTGARAQGDRVDVGASFVCASQNGSPSSGGMLGGAVDVVRWFGRLGVSAEAGAHEWDPQGSARWVGAGVRLAVLEGHARNPQGGVAGGRGWLDARVLAHTRH